MNVVLSCPWPESRSWDAEGACAAAPRASSSRPPTPPRARTARASRTASRSPIWPTRSRSSRAATCTARTRRALLRGLLELHEIPGDEFPWDPAAGDAFNSREAELERRVGRSAAGWLSAGRPRRESFRVGLRLIARDGIRDLHDALVDQAAALARHARATQTALATDYTYLQPAQPTTVGHLLLTYAYPALRDAARLRDLYARARAERRRRRRQRRLALGARPQRGSPSCSAPTG